MAMRGNIYVLLMDIQWIHPEVHPFSVYTAWFGAPNRPTWACRTQFLPWGSIQTWADWVRCYPLVNVYITIENHHFLMGKSTLNLAMFNSQLLVYQRVNLKNMEVYSRENMGNRGKTCGCFSNGFSFSWGTHLDLFLIVDWRTCPLCIYVFLNPK